MEESTEAELVEGVKAAVLMLDGLIAMGFDYSGEELRWKLVGRLAPVTPWVIGLLRPLVEMISMTLEPEGILTPSQNAYLDAIAGRSLESTLDTDQAVERSIT